jgi:hypothetical protein
MLAIRAVLQIMVLVLAGNADASSNIMSVTKSTVVKSASALPLLQHQQQQQQQQQRCIFTRIARFTSISSFAILYGRYTVV